MADAFATIYRSHSRQVFAWALRYCGGRRALAEDVVQEVFMRAFARWSDIVAGGDPAPWLYRATVNEAISRQRRERYSLRRLAWWRPNPEEPEETGLLESPDAKALLKALNTLEPVERSVMFMKLVDGLNNGEVARALDLSDGYVTKLTQRAVKRLQALGWRADDVS